MEVKRTGNKIPLGQKLVLQRIANSWHTEKVVVLYVTHNFKNDDKDIPLKDCNVESIYIKSEWKNAKQKITLEDTLRGFSKKWNIKKFKI